MSTTFDGQFGVLQHFPAAGGSSVQVLGSCQLRHLKTEGYQRVTICMYNNEPRSEKICLMVFLTRSYSNQPAKKRAGKNNLLVASFYMILSNYR